MENPFLKAAQEAEKQKKEAAEKNPPADPTENPDAPAAPEKDTKGKQNGIDASLLELTEEEKKAQEEKKSWKDLLNGEGAEDGEKKGDDAASAQNDEEAERLRKQNEELAEKLKAFESLIEEKKKTLVNPADLSEEEVIRLSAMQEGLTEEDIDSAIRYYQEIPNPLDRKTQINALRQRLDEKYQSELAKLSLPATQQGGAASAGEQKPQYSPEVMKNLEHSQHLLEETLDALQGTTWKGVVMTPQKVAKIRQTIDSLAKSDIYWMKAADGKADGKLNVDKAVRAAVYELYGDVIESEMKKESQAQGMKAAFLLKHRPSAGGTGGGSNKIPLDPSERAKQAGNMIASRGKR
jgi:hypothetical protein